jgi:hypothetical protein
MTKAIAQLELFRILGEVFFLIIFQDEARSQFHFGFQVLDAVCRGRKEF